MPARVIVLGNRDAGDDGAALIAIDRAAQTGLPTSLEVIRAGRPGAGLLDLLNPAYTTLLLDVVRCGIAPGSLISLPLERLPEQVAATAQTSSHGFGPAEALALGRQLGRTLPRGNFLGIEGASFEPGTGLSPGVVKGMAEFVEAIIQCAANIHVGTLGPAWAPVNQHA